MISIKVVDMVVFNDKIGLRLIRLNKRIKRFPKGVVNWRYPR